MTNKLTAGLAKLKAGLVKLTVEDCPNQYESY